MRRIREVLRLRHQGLTERVIARMIGVSNGACTLSAASRLAGLTWPLPEGLGRRRLGAAAAVSGADGSVARHRRHVLRGAWRSATCVLERASRRTRLCTDAHLSCGERHAGGGDLASGLHPECHEGVHRHQACDPAPAPQLAEHAHGLARRQSLRPARGDGMGGKQRFGLHFGRAGNAVLDALAAETALNLRFHHAMSSRPKLPTYASFAYQAGSWKRTRRDRPDRVLAAAGRERGMILTAAISRRMVVCC
jgi:hypothetical protein